MDMEILMRKLGAGLMEGGSPTSAAEQALHQLQSHLQQHLPDSWGCLHTVLIRWVQQDPRFAQYYHAPTELMLSIVQHIADNEPVLHEFVRQIDVRYGEQFQERPYFQQPGQAAHPDDEYTHESVLRSLCDFLYRV